MVHRRHYEYAFWQVPPVFRSAGTRYRFVQSHYPEALEIESKAKKPLADMERQDLINTITELTAMIVSLKLTIDTLRQTISSQNSTIASLQKSMDRLQSAYDKAAKERDDLRM